MSNIVGELKEVLNEKSIQISLIGGILFFILSQPATYSFVEKTLKGLAEMIGYSLSLQGNNLIIIHSIVFAILLTLSTNYILEPLFYNN
tara:strand:+ start:651 stop:917 length:267 start_codon:yes stop_codon:yes gene_type:complete